jgi:hypothetical protein
MKPYLVENSNTTHRNKQPKKNEVGLKFEFFVGSPPGQKAKKDRYQKIQTGQECYEMIAFYEIGQDQRA